MRVAEIEIVFASVSFGGSTTSVITRIGFSSLDSAKAEFDRLASLFETAKVDERNDDSKVEIVGDGMRHVFHLSEIRSIGLHDWAFSNAEMTGVRETFSALRWA